MLQPIQNVLILTAMDNQCISPIDTNKSEFCVSQKKKQLKLLS